MTCSKYERLLSAFLDRELTSAETAMVKKHVIECASCARLLDEFERIKDALEQLEPAEEPEGVFDMGLIRTRALQLEMEEEGSSAGTRRYGMFSFLGRALLPAALVGTLIAIPVLQFAFNVNITGAIAGLVTRQSLEDQLDETADVIIPDLNPNGIGTLGQPVVSSASYGTLTLGNTQAQSDLILTINDPRLSRYVQTFETSGSYSPASYRSNW